MTIGTRWDFSRQIEERFTEAQLDQIQEAITNGIFVRGYDIEGDLDLFYDIRREGEEGPAKKPWYKRDLPVQVFLTDAFIQAALDFPGEERAEQTEILDRVWEKVKDHIRPVEEDERGLARPAGRHSCGKEKKMENKMKDAMEQTTEMVLGVKGFDINTKEGLAAAAEFLKTATWNDTFLTESAPDDYPEELNEIDMFLGTIRLGMMREVVGERMRG